MMVMTIRKRVPCKSDILPCPNCDGAGKCDFSVQCGDFKPKIEGDLTTMSKKQRRYIENPKTKGSGVICCIPQKGVCPIGCADCFFQSGRSYLEPLEDNLPNMPNLKMAKGRVVRVNDGNDSNNKPYLVLLATDSYVDKFYNTSVPENLEEFDAPVVLTVNPAENTDCAAVLVDPIPSNLMFVRARVNTWNLGLIDTIVDYYSSKEVPIILTFMAYYTNTIKSGHEADYTYRQRTLNSYWVITQEAWDRVMARYTGNKWVYSCGKDANAFACHRCGNCLREYYATKERLREVK
jgi:hypothetical protein